MPIGPEHILRKAVKAIHVDYFLSAEKTGTGVEVSIPHGLGVTPTLVFFFITGDAGAAWRAYSITEGTHDSTNLKVNVTSDMKYRAFAIA